MSLPRSLLLAIITGFSAIPFTWAATPSDPALSAFQQGQFPTAIQLWEQALPTLTTVAQRIDTLTYLATAYRAMGLATEAKKALQKALTLTKDSRDTTRQAMVSVNLSELWLLTYAPDQADEVIDITKQAIETARPLSRPFLLASVLNQFGNLLTVQASQVSPESAWNLYDEIVPPLSKQTLPEQFAELPQALANIPDNYRDTTETPLACETQRSATAESQQIQLKQIKPILEDAKQWVDSASNQWTMKALIYGLEAKWLKRDQRPTDAQEAFQQALFYAQWDTYQYALTLAQRSNDKELTLKILLNLLQMSREVKNVELKSLEKPLHDIFQQAFTLLQSLPVSYDTTNHWLTLANWMMMTPTVSSPKDLEIALHTAFTQAQQLQNPRLQSLAYGQLGQWQERHSQFDQALPLTRQAIFFAQSITALDLLYRWQWQLGRLLRASSQETEALRQYQQAVENLEKLRHTAGVTATDEVFEQEIKPIYLELAELQLRQNHVKEALQTIERYKPVELENYFKDNCVVNFEVEKEKQSSQSLPPRTAVLYPLVLPNQFTLVVQLPGNGAPIDLTPSSPVVTETMLNSLETRFLNNMEARHGESLYQLLIHPLETYLEKHQIEIETLVIVPMEHFYQLPFAALSDGKQYLVEKYALAITPGLTLTKTASPSPEEKRLLLGGLSEQVANYSRLCHVRQELNAVQSFYPLATRLDNDQFTKTLIQHELRDHHHSLVLFATHAKFSSVARESFILTHDGQMTLNELEQLIRGLPQPVELLTLSACETAKGDNWQAALGLAGVAVKAGTQSALGSLWKVDDKATSTLMTEFYKQLQLSPPPSKAKALQQAQRVLLSRPEYRMKPGLWAGFVLIGQWQ